MESMSGILRTSDTKKGQSMNVVITGGCGFIGVNLVRSLMTDNEPHRVRVIDNLSVGSRQDLMRAGEFVEVRWQESLKPLGRGIELVIADVRDREIAESACQGADAIVHLAANTGVLPSIEDPLSDLSVNVNGTFNYLQAAKLNGGKRFVFASSGAPLGDRPPPIHEEMAPHPISPYGASKLCGEAYCSAFHGSYGLGTVALRFGNVYGPHSSHKGSVVARFIRHLLAAEPLTIYGDGNQTRDFIHVEDIVSAIVLSLKTPGLGGEIFQIATHQEHTVSEVAETLTLLAEKYLRRTSPIVREGERKGEVRRNFSDITKARKILGFEPKYDLKRGLEQTFLWFVNRNSGTT
jgi:UDP-glucose 4-epimerase